MDFIFPLIALLLSALSTLAVMPCLLKACYKRGLFDLPDNRKVHKNSIPRLGGVVFVPALIVGFFGAIGIMKLCGVPTPNTFHLSSMCIGAGAILVYLTGVVDDLVGCKAKMKFLIQTIAALSFPLCGLHIDSLYGLLGIYELPPAFSYLLTVFLSLLIINAINLIDGIDGLAAGLSIIALASYAYLFDELQVNTFVLISASLLGTLFAFLPFNLWGSVERKHKTFMGDSGSLLLGLVLSYMTIKYAMSDSTRQPYHADGLLMAFTLLIVPCFDLTRVALCRLLRGQGMFSPDKTHIHHKFMAAGLSMHETLIAILTLQIGYIFMNISLFNFGLDILWILLLDAVIYTLIHILLPIQKKNLSD